jgi:hypothetical protein
MFFSEIHVKRIFWAKIAFQINFFEKIAVILFVILKQKWFANNRGFQFYLLTRGLIPLLFLFANQFCLSTIQPQIDDAWLKLTDEKARNIVSLTLKTGYYQSCIQTIYRR